MVKFMKEKLELEPEEMKLWCEEYRKTRQLEATSPDPDNENEGFQK